MNNYIYITDSEWGKSDFANQIQSASTFSELEKLTNIRGFFRNNNYNHSEIIQTNPNLTVLTPNYIIRILTKISGIIGSILNLRIVHPGIRDFLYGYQLLWHIKKIKGEKTIYTRVNIFSIYILYRFRSYLRIKKIIYECHNYDPELPAYCKFNFEKKIVYRLYKGVIKNVDCVVTITKNLSDYLRNMFGNDSIVIPSAHDFQIDKPKELKETCGRIIQIVYTGFYYKYKGIIPLLNSLSYLPDNFSLVLVGGLKYEINEIKLQYPSLLKINRLILKGRIPHNTIKDFLMKEADIGVVSLPKDGMGLFASCLKQFEYMAVGLPIIAPDIPSIREILENNRNAILVDFENSKTIADGVLKIASNLNFAKTLGHNAWVDSQQFNYGSRAKKIFDIMKV